MTGPDQPQPSQPQYARVYHSIVEQMGEAWADLAFVGAWTKLHLVADAAYPLPPSLPRWLDEDMLERLVASGLVQRVGAENYTMAGLAHERQQRAAKRAEGRAVGGHRRAEKADRGEDGRFLPNSQLVSQQPIQLVSQQPTSNRQQHPASAQQASSTQAKPTQADTEQRESLQRDSARGTHLGIVPDDPRHPVAKILASRFRFRAVTEDQWDRLWECVDNEYPRGTKASDPRAGWTWVAELMRSLPREGGDPISAVFREVKQRQQRRLEAAT